MNETTFWDWIDKSYQREKGDTELQADWLIDNLQKATKEDLIGFHQQFLRQLDKVYRTDFQSICAYILKDDLSDEDEERFDYFCAWLISLGRKNFDAILQNPDAMADFLEKDQELDECVCESETMLYIADIAYEEKTGKDDFYDLFDAEVVLMLKGSPIAANAIPQKFPNIARKVNA
ncbi:MAG: DUF4240 domain-containing protein [Bacteroidia bacterium]